MFSPMDEIGGREAVHCGLLLERKAARRIYEHRVAIHDSLRVGIPPGETGISSYIGHTIIFHSDFMWQVG